MPHFERGAIMRAPSADVRAGGKGIDAARVGKSLKKRSPLLVLIGDIDGGQFSQLLVNEGLDFRRSSYHGNIRVATMYHEDNSPTTTIVNEEGPTVSQIEWDEFLKEISAELQPREIVASMGSFPMGINEENIAELISLVQERNSLIFFDAAPHFLAWALRHGADIVSPNLDEAEAVLSGLSEDLFRGEDSNGQLRAERAALSLCTLGAKIAIVHAGVLGSALAYGGKSIWVPTVDVIVASAVGAGDSLAAGFILKSEEQGDVTKMDSIDWKLSLQYGTATAAAACEMGRSGDVDPVRVDQLFEQLLEVK